MGKHSQSIMPGSILGSEDTRVLSIIVEFIRTD